MESEEIVMADPAVTEEDLRRQEENNNKLRSKVSLRKEGLAKLIEKERKIDQMTSRLTEAISTLSGAMADLDSRKNDLAMAMSKPIDHPFLEVLVVEGIENELKELLHLVPESDEEEFSTEDPLGEIKVLRARKAQVKERLLELQMEPAPKVNRTKATIKPAKSSPSVILEEDHSAIDHISSRAKQLLQRTKTLEQQNRQLEQQVLRDKKEHTELIEALLAKVKADEKALHDTQECVEQIKERTDRIGENRRTLESLRKKKLQVIRGTSNYERDLRNQQTVKIEQEGLTAQLQSKSAELRNKSRLLKKKRKDLGALSSSVESLEGMVAKEEQTLLDLKAENDALAVAIQRQDEESNRIRGEIEAIAKYQNDGIDDFSLLKFLVTSGNERM